MLPKRTRSALTAQVQTLSDGSTVVTVVIPSDNLDAVVERMIASVPDIEPFNDKVGPLYLTSSLRKWLGITRQGIDSHVKRRNILALRLADRVRGYPAWQFGPRGELLPGLATVSRMIDPAGNDPLAVALVLGSKSNMFDGRTGAELLRAGDTETVFDAVTRAARAPAN